MGAVHAVERLYFTSISGLTWEEKLSHAIEV